MRYVLLAAFKAKRGTTTANFAQIMQNQKDSTLDIRIQSLPGNETWDNMDFAQCDSFWNPQKVPYELENVHMF